MCATFNEIQLWQEIRGGWKDAQFRDNGSVNVMKE